ncbi:hypothetical protein [Nocardioides sp. InS609-2]|uniref:hypothetical protein n=1 Tax=Nocardioides sp. InS609-2 TaxID=2760705 RepID=UPI0020C07258|nr:hypothetical protein [Nocardioides sp. InS609-2]
MSIQLTEATESQIAEKHRDAASAITDLASGIPTTIDGGYGTADLMAILGAVIDTADDIAMVNEVAAEQVTAVGQGLGDTDDEVAENFSKIKVVVE